ncbi:neuraminidase-like domain-containing protein [Pseudomonas sp. DR48]|uniref:Tc toxin subunit A-related protein n=1 Tax=Pseudomonas sp. DR48 TaxID=2871095 RepID=UPI001C99BF2B|nr:neuraminidase-like domain-containing protein [Pseudomonas sp. DR48]QZP35156.1 hypothetical protein K5K95_12460 [Pseudomonas sp. DR48]
MTVALKKQLDESLRDALLAYYLNCIAPANATTKTLKTAQSLYEHWLLDVRVGHDVPTTPVACAIASLQQYINRILLNMEPGYDSATITHELAQTWRKEMHQYASWAALQKLLYFPATYLDPGLRDNKSDNFRQLENDLNQDRLQPDAVQTAVLAYLTRLEEVANLNILNGYIDGDDFVNSNYYFIAKSRSENTFYWRSLDMARRPSDKEQSDSLAWSDWKKADVPIPVDAIEHSIRPVWFNNRLFVIWADCIHQDPAPGSAQNQTTQRHPLFRLNLSYLKHDGNWSSARTWLQGYSNNATLQNKDLSSLKSMVGTVAVYQQENTHDRLFIALHVSQRDTGNNGNFIFLKTATIDKNLTHSQGITIDKGSREESRTHPHYSLANGLRGSLDKISFQLKVTEKTRLNESKTLKKSAATAELMKENIEQLDERFAVSINYVPSTKQVTLRISDTGKDQLGVTEDYSIQYVVRRPETTVSPEENTSGNADKTTLPKSYTFRFQPHEFSENGENLYYGFCITKNDNTKQYCLAAINLSLSSHFLSPSIGVTDAAQFLDFSQSTMSNSENILPTIRLNTVFAAELIRRTENSLDELFSRDTQQLPEPKIASTASVATMDFHGPYGRYFTELFLYLPWLIAHRLNSEHQYEEAERWIRFLFDPGRQPPQYWNAVPLTGPDVPSYSNQAPQDPHQIALSHPVHFRKALYFLYLNILINRGDAAYRELTPDSLSEAKLWYVRALDLLGSRPEVQRVDQWSAISLQALSKTTSKDLRTFENTLARSNPSSFPMRKGSSRASLPAIDTSHLHLPFNPALLKRWDITENRLHNLRHNLDIAGKPLHRPLFTTPPDPHNLLDATALSASGGMASSLPGTQMPHYRFTAMHSQALNAVESVSQFGATLLSLIERKEQGQLQELQQQQAWSLAKMSVDLQTQALRIDRQNRQALLASKAIAQGRLSHYQRLLEKDVSEAETQASQLYLSSGSSELTASAAQVVAGGMMMVPNIFGFSNGGSRWEGAMHATTALAHGTAIATRTAAAHLDRRAQFSRRREEWTLTRDQAQLELVKIDAQLAHFAEQESATRLQLRQAETALNHTKASYDFLSRRFTKTQLYQWLNSQLTALYYQAYDATLALCMAAEACWQYERADFSTRFVQPGGWNTTYRGLGAGEHLKLSLLKMQAEYWQRNERELEIRKTVSLRQIKSKDKHCSINEEWADIHTKLKSGACDFKLTHAMFEDDYKDQNHYLRRIKTISVSLPALLGPYENIRATLTQTSSKVFMSPGDKGPALENKRASQQIALSTGVDDHGLFTLNFNDERYLPFEYTGAISTWHLTFPNPDAQKAMLESLTDIIVHVSYTARVGDAQ